MVQPQTDVFKSNPEKKKKPIEMYLDTVNHLYKKRDLDILINPVTPQSVFESWSPREVAIFEESMLKFGKQFEFISELIGTKNVKEVYEFYLEWKCTSHYKSYKAFISSNNRNNIEDMVWYLSICIAIIHAILRIRWYPLSVDTMSLIYPGCSLNDTSSKGFCICPRSKKPRSPPFWQLEHSE